MTTPTTQREADERAKFEAWAMPIGFNCDYIEGRSEHRYLIEETETAWGAWKARASLTPTAPANDRQHHVEQVARMTKTNLALAGTVNDLAALARRLLHALNFADPGNGIAKVAANYLKRENLQGDPIRAEDVLRDSATPTAPQAATTASALTSNMPEIGAKTAETRMDTGFAPDVKIAASTASAAASQAAPAVPDAPPTARCRTPR